MPELKPCPFCGCNADLWSKYAKYGYFLFCQCDFCEARTKGFKLGYDLPEDWANSKAAQKAIEAWNSRKRKRG